MRYATGDKQLIKEINRTSILNLIRDQELISRAEIAKILGLTPATVSSAVNDLVRRGIVKESGMGDSSGGRKPVLLGLEENRMYFIGVDIHKDGVKAAIVNIKGKILYSVERAFRGILDDLQGHVNATIREVRAISHLDSSKLYGIGIGMHGVVDIDNEITVFVPAMALRNVVIKPYVEREQKLPVIIDNDSNAMAIGERQFGNARGLENFVFVNAGKGIGAGIVLNGEIFYGKNFTAGEVGHIHVSDNGLKCVCGRYGCLDTVASERSMVNDFKNKLQSGIPSIVVELVDNNLERVNLDVIIQAARMGDAYATNALERAGHYIGIAMSYVINILSPESIVFGGSMSLAGDYILGPFIEAATKASMVESIEGVTIVPSATGENAGVIGAATMVIQQYLEEITKVPPL